MNKNLIFPLIKTQELAGEGPASQSAQQPWASRFGGGEKGGLPANGEGFRGSRRGGAVAGRQVLGEGLSRAGPPAGKGEA